MKTTIDIPENELQEVIKYTGAKTKKEAVVFAIRDFNQRHRLAQVSKILGTFEDFMTQDELKKCGKLFKAAFLHLPILSGMGDLLKR